MRAKMQIQKIEQHPTLEILTFTAVSNGSPEDNTYSKYTPSGSLTLRVTNPELLGKFKPSEKYYLDFSKAEE